MQTKTINRREVLQKLAGGTVATAVLALSKPTAAAAADISMDKVPAAIKKAANHVVKDAKWDSAMKSKDDGQDFYELFGTHTKGMNASIEVSADAKVTSVELQIDLKDVPKTAMKSINSRMTAFKPDTVLAMYAGDDIRDLSKAELTYQLNGTAAKGKDLTVEISADGKITEVKREIEIGEVPKAVSDALSSKAPKFNPDVVHRVTRDDKVAGFLFAGKRGWVVWLSHDCKEFEIHKDD